MTAHHPALNIGHHRNGDGGETTANLNRRGFQFAAVTTGLMINDLLLLPGRVPDVGTHGRRKGNHAGNSDAGGGYEVHRPEVRPEKELGTFRRTAAVSRGVSFWFTCFLRWRGGDGSARIDKPGRCSSNTVVLSVRALDGPSVRTACGSQQTISCSLRCDDVHVDLCQGQSRTGSSTHLMKSGQDFGVLVLVWNQAALTMRKRSKSKLARPYMERLISFNL